jgi:hypothetical protein
MKQADDGYLRYSHHQVQVVVFKSTLSCVIKGFVIWVEIQVTLDHISPWDVAGARDIPFA